MSHTPGKPDIGYTTGFYEGVAAERERIIELLDSIYDFSNAIYEAEFKLPDGNDVLEVNDAISAFNAYRAGLLALIKEEQKSKT